MTLLLDERPVVLQPSLVRRLGIVEAALVQQLHYWAQRATRIHEGETWVYKTYADWSDEVGVTAKAARGALDRLRRDGAVVAMANPNDPRDRTLWWRVVYEVVDPDDPQGTSSAPAGRQLAVAGIPSAPAGSSNAGASQRRSESTTQSTATSGTRASSDEWPEGIKNTAAADAIFVVIDGVAREHGAKVVTKRALGHAMLSAPGRDFIGEAHRMASYYVGRQCRDVVATYRNWLGRAEERHPAVAASGSLGAARMRPRDRTGRTTAEDYLSLLDGGAA